MPATETLELKRDSRGPFKKPVIAKTNEPLRVERSGNGQLRAVKNGVTTFVRVCRCFPWTEPSRYISLRDEKENEIALIGELGELDAASREAVEHALVEAGFVLEITRMLKAEEVFEVRNWVVETKQGARTFQTKLDEWPRELPNGGFMVRDLCGDLYFIASPETMDAQSQKILWSLID